MHALPHHPALALAFLLGSLLTVPSSLVAQSSPPADTTDAAVAVDLDALSLESLLDVSVNAAARYDQTAREAPASVTVITAEEIERYGHQTLAQVLAQVRGLYLQNNLSFTNLGVRGFNRVDDHNRRILILVDGYPFNEAAVGSSEIDDHLGLDLGQVEHIEVVRGPGSALYGTGAMHTVINIVTKTPAALDGAAATVRAGTHAFHEGALSLGKQFAPDVGVAVSGQWGHQPGHDLYFPEYDTPETNNGIAEARNWRRYANARLRARYRHVELRSYLAQTSKGIPIGSIRVFNHDASRARTGLLGTELAYDQAFGSRRHVTAQAHIRRYTFGQRHPIPIPDDFDVSIIPGLEGIDPEVIRPLLPDMAIVDTEGHSTSIGGNAQLRLDVGLRHRLMLGVEAATGTLNFAFLTELYNGEIYAVDAAFVSVSAYAQDEFRISRHLNLTLGGRLDQFRGRRLAVTPRAALVYHPSTASTFKALYGEAFRAPSLAELHDNSFLRSFLPNPNLEPERIRTLELVWEQELTNALSGAVVLYDYRMRGLIGQVYDPEGEILQRQNIDNVDARGAEVELRARLDADRQAYVSYAYQWAQEAGTTERLVNSPAHLGKAGLVLPVARAGHAALTLRAESGRRTLARARTDAFVLADAHLTSPPLWNGLTLGLSVRNVLDHTYALPAGNDVMQDTLVQAGRTFVLRACYRL